MAEKIVLYSPYQKASSDDLNDGEKFARESVDHVVKDAVVGGQGGFAGFTVSKKSAAVANVAGGRYYTANGEVYFRNDDGGLDFNLIGDLPAVSKRIATILITAPPETQTAREQREFLRDVVTRTTEASDVATEVWRWADVTYNLGNESANPTAKNPDSGEFPIAYLTLDPNGIVSIVMNAENALPSVKGAWGLGQSNSQRINAMQPLLNTLGGDVARLAAQMVTKADISYVERIARDTARLKSKAGLPATYTDYGATYFLDGTLSQTGYAGYAATVEDGLRFPAGATSAGSALALVNPTDPLLKVANGIVLPVYDVVRWREHPEPLGEMAFPSYAYYALPLRYGDFSPWRWRFGEHLIVSAASSWWGTVQFVDPAKTILVRGGEVYAVVDRIPDWRGVRLRRVWVDSLAALYWWNVAAPAVPVSGYPWTQTMLASQDMWVVEMGIPFSRLDSSGPVTFFICECTDSGVPDHSKTIASVTVPFSELGRTVSYTYGGTTEYVANFPNVVIDTSRYPTIYVYPAGDPSSGGLPISIESALAVGLVRQVRQTLTVASVSAAKRHAFPPTLLKAGKRYGVGAITPANHWFHFIPVQNYFNGALWYWHSANRWERHPDRHFPVDLGIAQFRDVRAEVQFGTVSLGGGVQKIDITANAIVPEQARLDWQVQVAGVWQDFNDFSASPLVAYPTDVGLRAVMQGTRSAMPALKTTGSVLKVSRSTSPMKWVSTAFTLAASSTGVKVTAQLQGYIEAIHDCDLKIRTAGVERTPSVTTDRIINTDMIERTATFTVPATTSLELIVNAVSSDNNAPFVVSELDYVSTP